jgi:2-dehydropantoate 2-reductase
MRILVYGAGAIGCIFGGRLMRTGCEVTLLARGAWKETLERDGLALEDCLSGRLERSRPRVIAELAPDDIYNYVLVVMQSTQVAAVLPALAANRSPNIVFVVNTALGYGPWSQAVGAGRVMAGFPAAGGERRADRVSCFVARGALRLFQATTFGEPDGRDTPRLRVLVGLFRRAGFAPATCRNMAAWQRTHVGVVVSIGKALYRHGSDNYALSRDRAGLRLMVDAIRESFAVLEAGGGRVTPGRLRFFRWPAWLLVPVLARVLDSRMAEYAMAKHTVAAKDEMGELERQFRDLTAAAGAALPSWDRL